MVLDPSSSQTGIVIGTMSGELLLLMDYKNLVLSKRDFMDTLNDYLRRICAKLVIKFMVYEVTYDRSGDTMASVVLKDLEDNFKTYEKFIVGLDKENMYPILPSVWRKNFLYDSRYTGLKRDRMSLKSITRKECDMRYPKYHKYFYKTESPPDSTDAIGIYHGFLNEYWYDKGQNIRKISKVNSRYSRNHNYTSEIIAYESRTILGHAVQMYNTLDVVMFAYNNGLDLDENIEIATAQTDKPCVIFALDEIATALLRWSVEKGDPNRQGIFCAVICRRCNEKE